MGKCSVLSYWDSAWGIAVFPLRLGLQRIEAADHISAHDGHLTTFLLGTFDISSLSFKTCCLEVISDLTRASEICNFPSLAVYT